MNDIADIFSNKQVDGDFFYPGPETAANGVAPLGVHRQMGRVVDMAAMGSDDIDMFVGAVDIKGFLLTGRFQPFLLLGGGTMTVRTKVTNPTAVQQSTEFPPNSGLYVPNRGPVTQARNYQDFVFRFGGGIDLYATEHVVVNLGATYLLPLGNVRTLDVYTFGGGLEYRF